jgi:hypothetical protein
MSFGRQIIPQQSNASLMKNSKSLQEIFDEIRLAVRD